MNEVAQACIGITLGIILCSVVWYLLHRGDQTKGDIPGVGDDKSRTEADIGTAKENNQRIAEGCGRAADDNRQLAEGCDRADQLIQEGKKILGID